MGDCQQLIQEVERPSAMVVRKKVVGSQSVTSHQRLRKPAAATLTVLPDVFENVGELEGTTEGSRPRLEFRQACSHPGGVASEEPSEHLAHGSRDEVAIG